MSRVTSSMNSGTPPARSLMRLITSARQRALRDKFGDHALNLRFVEGRKRNDLVVRPQAPGRAKFRPRGRQNEEGRLRASFAERLHESDRGRVEPLQILKHKNDRLDASAGQPPLDHRRQLFARNLFRRKVGQALKPDRNVDERPQQRGMLDRIELGVGENRFEFSEPPLRRNLGTPEPCARPPERGMERRVLQQLR